MIRLITVNGRLPGADRNHIDWHSLFRLKFKHPVDDRVNNQIKVRNVDRGRKMNNSGTFRTSLDLKSGLGKVANDQTL